MYYLIPRYYNPNHGVFLSVDPNGHYAIALAAAGTNFWNPVGWFIAGGLAIYTGYQVYKFAKSNYNPDSYARPGQKNRERK